MGDGEESGRGVVGRRRHLTHKLWQWGIKRSWGCEDIKDTSADRTWQRDGHHGREGGQHLSRLYQEGFPSLFSDKQGRADKPEQAVTRAWLRPSQTGMLVWISWLRKGLHWISGRSWNVYSGVITAGIWCKAGGGERRFRPGLSREDYKGLWAPQWYISAHQWPHGWCPTLSCRCNSGAPAWGPTLEEKGWHV